MPLPGAGRAGQCLRYLLNAQFSNVAVGNCDPASWSSQVNGPDAMAGISSFLYNTSDSTIRFIYRDSYDLNHKNSSICLTASWGEPCEPAEFAKLPFCDTAKSADERIDDLNLRIVAESLRGPFAGKGSLRAYGIDGAFDVLDVFFGGLDE